MRQSSSAVTLADEFACNSPLIVEPSIPHAECRGVSAMPNTAEPWSLTSLKERLSKLHAKVVSHVRYVTFQMAKTVVPRQMLAR